MTIHVPASILFLSLVVFGLYYAYRLQRHIEARIRQQITVRATREVAAALRAGGNTFRPQLVEDVAEAQAA